MVFISHYVFKQIGSVSSSYKSWKIKVDGVEASSCLKWSSEWPMEFDPLNSADIDFLIDKCYICSTRNETLIIYAIFFYLSSDSQVYINCWSVGYKCNYLKYFFWYHYVDLGNCTKVMILAVDYLKKLWKRSMS